MAMHHDPPDKKKIAFWAGIYSLPVLPGLAPAMLGGGPTDRTVTAFAIAASWGYSI